MSYILGEQLNINPFMPVMCCRYQYCIRLIGQKCLRNLFLYAVLFVYKIVNSLYESLSVFIQILSDTVYYELSKSELGSNRMATWRGGVVVGCVCVVCVV